MSATGVRRVKPPVAHAPGLPISLVITMTQQRVPAGPKGHWLSGNLPDFRRDRLDFFVQCARDYGDVVKIRFAHRSIYLVSHPDFIEEVLVTHSKNFSKHFALRLNPLVLGKGLLTSEGDFWLRQRRLIQPVFVRSRIVGYAAAMVTATERLIADWKPGERRDIMGEMMRVTLEIAATTEQLPEVLGILSARQGLAIDLLEWTYDEFEASIPATADAMRMARRKADAVADAAGLRVTGIRSASDTWSMPSPRVEMASFASDARMRVGAAPLDMGLTMSSSTKLSVRLTVDFEVAANDAR